MRLSTGSACPRSARSPSGRPARLIALADEHGLRVNTCRDPEKRGGVVTFDVPNGLEVTRELARREILVDFRQPPASRSAALLHHGRRVGSHG